jgi:hypothetical protein
MIHTVRMLPESLLFDSEQRVRFFEIPLPHPDGKNWTAALWEDEKDKEDIIFLGIPQKAAFEFVLCNHLTGLVHFEHQDKLYVLIELIADFRGNFGLRLHDAVLAHVQKTLGRPLRRHPDRSVVAQCKTEGKGKPWTATRQG